MCKYCETYQDDHSYDFRRGESQLIGGGPYGSRGGAWDYFPDNDDVELFNQDGEYEGSSGMIVNGKLRVLVSGDGAGCGDHDINFCPMCGRDLRADTESG